MSNKLKHLEFIQGVINRLSVNSFLLKGWSVVLVSGFFALASSQSKIGFVCLAFIPALVFWGLDGYFVGLERIYRQHYNKVRTVSEDDIDFSMDIAELHEGFVTWVNATMSKTLIPFYGVLVVAILIVTLMYC